MAHEGAVEQHEPAPKPAFRAGDTVLHRPSNETWVLACDQDRAWVLPAGWPESLAKAEECELLDAASDADRLEMLIRVSGCSPSSYRTALATRQLEATR